MFGKYVIHGLFLIASMMFAQQGDRIDLGTLQTGASFSFVRTAGGVWGIEISGGTTPRLIQQEPAIIEVFRTEEDILKLAAGYKSVQKSTPYLNARAEISYDNAVFRIEDRWSLNRDVVSVQRKVEVAGNAPGGFNSSVVFKVDPSVNWSDINCMAPGALYGDPTYSGDRSPGGTLNDSTQRFLMREDILPAPLFSISFNSGSSIAILDPFPRCESTFEETKLLKDAMTDERFQFGAFGVWQQGNNPIEFGFQFPGTTSIYSFGPNAPVQPRWIRRFHPIAQGVIYNYEVNFRFGQNESFREVTRNTWRWAWS
ncbi:MAG: hypothetical protein ACM339_07720, partial [Ignavibacteria bacterium]